MTRDSMQESPLRLEEETLQETIHAFFRLLLEESFRVKGQWGVGVKYFHTEKRLHLRRETERKAASQAKEKLCLSLGTPTDSESQRWSSLSHCEDLALAVSYENAKEKKRWEQGPRPKRVLGVGVDCEPLHRKVSEKLTHRILWDEERKWFGEHALSGLELWCLKESMFKATPMNQGRIIKESVIEQVTPLSEHSWKIEAKSKISEGIQLIGGGMQSLRHQIAVSVAIEC